MKKIVISIFILSISIKSALACPYCGCGNSNFQIGLMPNFSKGFLGTRYTYSSFRTDSSSQFSRDYFHVTELWGGYTFGKLQVMAFVPFLSIHKLSDDGVVNSTGLGDVTMLATYEVLSRTKTREQRASFTNKLWLGGGIKLPTGKSVVDTSDPSFTVGDFSGTVGTGSTDFMLNANHTILIGNHGIVTNVAYRINMVNKNDFQYGNRVHINSAYFYSFNQKFWVIRPTGGFNLVSNAVNKFQNQVVEGSSGYVLSVAYGVNVQKGDVGLQLNGFTPLAQDLYNGLTKMGDRFSVAITYSF